MLHQLTLSALLKHRQPKGQQQIFQDREIALGALSRKLRLPGQGCQVELTGLREADHLEKTAEIADLTHQGFRLNLLLQIERGIGGQIGLGVAGLPDQGHQANRQGPVQVKG